MGNKKTCSAIVGSGEICRYKALPDSDYCGRHKIPTTHNLWADPALQKTILEQAAASTPWGLVARAAGVPARVLEDWAKLAASPECPPDLAEFMAKVDQAAARGGMMLHSLALTSASAPTVRAAMWNLENRFPEYYLPQTRPVEMVALWEPIDADEIIEALTALQESSVE